MLRSFTLCVALICLADGAVLRMADELVEAGFAPSLQMVRPETLPGLHLRQSSQHSFLMTIPSILHALTVRSTHPALKNS
jgi:hypothetical protein